MSNKKKNVIRSVSPQQPRILPLSCAQFCCFSAWVCMDVCLCVWTLKQNRNTAGHNTSDWCKWKVCWWNERGIRWWVFVCVVYMYKRRCVGIRVCYQMYNKFLHIYMCVCASARICCDGMVYDGGRIGSRHRCSELRSFSLPAVVMRMMIMTLMMMMMMMIHYEGSQD